MIDNAPQIYPKRSQGRQPLSAVPVPARGARPPGRPTTKSMPEFDHKYTAILTNSRKPKPHQVVVKSVDGCMSIQRGGRPFPWPKDLVLVLKGKHTARHMLVHLNALSVYGVARGRDGGDCQEK